MKNIAIIGSRKYPRLDLVTRLLFGILEPRRHIITGDAKGVDATVALTVSMLALNPKSSHTLEVHQANWARHGRQAGPIRNQQILEHAEALIAFWDMISPGTADTIALAIRKDLPLYIYRPDGSLAPDPPSLFGQYAKPYLPDMSGPEYLPLDNPASTAEPQAAKLCV